MSNGQDKKGISKKLNAQYKSLFGKDHPSWVKPLKPGKPTEFDKASKRHETQTFLPGSGLEDKPYRGTGTATADSVRLNMISRPSVAGDKTKTSKQEAEQAYFKVRTLISLGKTLTKDQQRVYDEWDPLFGGKDQEKLSFTEQMNKLDQVPYDVEGRLYEIDPKTKQIATQSDTTFFEQGQTIRDVDPNAASEYFNTGEVYNPKTGEWENFSIIEKKVQNPNISEAERSELNKEIENALIEKAITIKASQLGVSKEAMMEKVAQNMQLGQQRIGSIQDEMLKMGVPNRIAIHYDLIAMGLIKRGEEVEAAKLKAYELLLGMFPNAFKQN